MVAPAESLTPIAIGILLYPECQLAMVHGIRDLLETAGHMAARVGGPSLRIDLWDATDTGLSLEAQRWPTPTVILVPGRLSGPHDEGALSPAIAWLARRHDAGTIVASCCGGAFLLAEAGLLAERPATTHWAFAEMLQSRSPTSRVDADRMLIDDGTIITAGGLMAWTDLGLHLIGMMFGEDVLQEVARFFLIDPGGREQGHYRSFVHPAANDDPAIRRVQEALVSKRAWMPVHEMARVAGLEERTFLRRFRAAIGMSPRDYGRAFHFEQARNMLRSTQRPVGQVAWAVGYADAATFTREFTREMGLPPGEYRRRFHPALGRN